jgi:hypothetical protein
MNALRLLIAALVVVGLCVPVADAQETAPLRDPLLTRLAGDWTITGTVMGDSVTYDATGKWVLNHQFLFLRMEDTQTPPQYAARVYVGYDSTDREYVAHWLDATGARAAETLGYGQRTDGALTLHFDDPDGPFRTTFAPRPDRRWRVRMEAKRQGEWGRFGAFEMTPQSAPPEAP